MAWILVWASYHGSVNGLTARMCNKDKIARMCIKDKISYGQNNTPLQSVRIVTCYSMFREGTTNVAGKELHEDLVNM